MRLFGKQEDAIPSLSKVSKIYTRSLQTHGETPKGVLWKSEQSQNGSFEVLAGILPPGRPGHPVGINDFGCGYGALFDFLASLKSLGDFTYTGYDMNEEMIDAARRRIDDPRATFKKATDIDVPADYTLVSGTFNLKLQTATAPWAAYVKSSLRSLWAMSRKGLAFNLLDKRQSSGGDSLYYADAAEFMDFCATLSPNLTLVDDYGLPEWTLFMSREAP